MINYRTNNIKKLISFNSTKSKLFFQEQMKRNRFLDENLLTQDINTYPFHFLPVTQVRKYAVRTRMSDACS